MGGCHFKYDKIGISLSQKPIMDSTHFTSTNEIRTQFTQAMSEMYQLEVPLYKKLLSLADKVNKQVITDPSKLTANEFRLLSLEHHGAIRIGTADELSMIRRLFAVMGMYPVDYYDLSLAGIPVHSTAFRALDRNDLEISPFRIFCSLLRLDLIEDDSLAQQAESLLNIRQIFPEELLKLIDLFEKQGGLTSTQVSSFINNALEVFRWHQKSTVEKQTYDALKASHGLIADVVSFKGPHINHLTPKILDIDECQKTAEQMSKFGIGAILDYSVEGEVSEAGFESTTKEIIKTIECAGNSKHIPFGAFKITGVGSSDLLTKVQAKTALNAEEEIAFQNIRTRVDSICSKAHELGVKVLIDAELIEKNGNGKWVKHYYNEPLNLFFNSGSSFQECLGQTHSFYRESIEIVYDERLTYFKKEDEEWGTPIDFSVLTISDPCTLITIGFLFPNKKSIKAIIGAL